MFEEFDAPRAKKAKPKKRNTLFRNKPKQPEVIERQPLDFEPDTPAMRKRKAAEARRKMIRWAVALVGVGALAVLGNAAIDETLLLNPRFALKQVFIETEGMLTRQQLRRAIEVADGVNLLTVNLADVRARLLNLPAVREAKVERDFEGRLSIEVTQRQPVAWVQCERLRYLPKTSGRGLLVDGAGYAIPAEVVLNEFDALPIIIDESILQAPAGAVIEAPHFTAALTLLKRLKASEASSGAVLQSIAMPNSFALESHFADGACVTFGYDHLDEQLARYEQVLAVAKAKRWSIVTLNVIAQHNMPAAFRDEAGAAVNLDEPEPESPSKPVAATPATTPKRSATSSAKASPNRRTSTR